jgi:hypothetical protein
VIRFRSRHLHATIVEHVRTRLDTLGWISAPINFSTAPCIVVDYQPDERGHVIATNTVAVTLADFHSDQDEELGATYGGLRSAPYSLYVDVYMAEQALSIAICDDVRDIFTDLSLELIDQISGLPVYGAIIEIERVTGPEKPPAASSAEQFKRYWRIMQIHTRLYYPAG